jgi:hypothetical protein
MSVSFETNLANLKARLANEEKQEAQFYKKHKYAAVAILISSIALELFINSGLIAKRYNDLPTGIGGALFFGYAMCILLVSRSDGPRETNTKMEMQLLLRTKIPKLLKANDAGVRNRGCNLLMNHNLPTDLLSFND